MYRGLPIILLGLLVGVLLAGCTRAEPGQAINKTAAQVPILMYHHIGAPPNPNDTRAARLYVAPDQLDRQLTEIQQAGYTTITLDDLVSALNGGAALPDKPLILTFDDGYQDFYSNAYPLLQHHHDKATAYIITGRVGKSGYMTWDELAELASAPLITIGAHTQTHPHLAKHSTTRVRDELKGSKTDLEAHLRLTVHHLAYPSGSYNRETIELARQTGYTTAVTVHYGVRARADKLLELPRVFVQGGMPIEQLLSALQGQRDKQAPTEKVSD